MSHRTLRSSLSTIALDEGPTGWRAGPSDLTRVDTGTVDPRILLDLPGANGEHRLFESNCTGRLPIADWIRLIADLKTHGMRDPVTVHAEQDGRIEITEGNHRLRAAADAGVLASVEIKYFGNVQRNGAIL